MKTALRERERNNRLGSIAFHGRVAAMEAHTTLHLFPKQRQFVQHDSAGFSLLYKSLRKNQVKQQK